MTMATLRDLEPTAKEILKQERAVYEKSNPKSREAFERSCRVLPGGVSRALCYFPPFPCQTAYGDGCWMVDADGHRRLDLFNCATALILGHRPPVVVKAVEEQLTRGTVYQTNSGLETVLAEMLVERVASVEQIRFTNSGSEGTQMAIRAARALTGRPTIAKMEGGYHGTHDCVENSVRVPAGSGGPPDAPVPVAGSAGITPGVLRDVVIIPYNNLEAAKRILAAHAAELACVIVEPILGSVGFVPAEREFLVGLRQEAQRLGIIFILDEVQSFRLDCGGAQKLFGITPDLTCFGKIIGGGFPVGAFGGRRDIMGQFNTATGRGTIPHAGTFNANPITMAAGIATMEQLTEPAYTRLNTTGDALRDRLRALGARYQVPMYVSGIGSMFKIHFSEGPVRCYRDTLQSNNIMHTALFLFGMNRGVFLSEGGRCCLSVPIGDADLGTYLDVVEEFLAALTR
jgi:glutamate-1-semialdehyde 2,1-aminomutase